MVRRVDNTTSYYFPESKSVQKSKEKLLQKLAYERSQFNDENLRKIAEGLKIHKQRNPEASRVDLSNITREPKSKAINKLKGILQGIPGMAKKG